MSYPVAVPNGGFATAPLGSTFFDQSKRARPPAPKAMPIKIFDWATFIGVPAGYCIEGHTVQRDFVVKVSTFRDSYIASAKEQTLSISGNSAGEAFANLLELLVDYYEEDLEATDQEVGQVVANQRAYLKRLFDNVS